MFRNSIQIYPDHVFGCFQKSVVPIFLKFRTSPLPLYRLANIFPPLKKNGFSFRLKRWQIWRVGTNYCWLQQRCEPWWRAEPTISSLFHPFFCWLVETKVLYDITRLVMPEHVHQNLEIYMQAWELSQELKTGEFWTNYSTLSKSVGGNAVLSWIISYLILSYLISYHITSHHISYHIIS